VTFICGVGTKDAPFDALRTLSQLGSCCLGAVTEGPVGCTCWVPEYDLEQREDLAIAEPATREIMCSTCAYRSTSPERNGDPNYQFSDDELPVGPTPFWCHQGMRKPLRWRHRLGITIEATGDYYDPPMRTVDRAGIPYKADGTPGDRCAGWAAARRRLGCGTAQLLADAAEATTL